MDVNLRSVFLPVMIGLITASFLTLYGEISIAVGVGSILVIMAVRTSKQDRNYAFTGTLFILGYGVLLWYLPVSDGVVPQWTLLILGGISGIYLAVKWSTKYLVQRSLRGYLDSESIAELWDAVASIGSIIYLVWNFLQATERVVRTVMIAVGGSSSFLVTVFLSPENTGIAPWVFDLAIIIFLVTVVLGFHTIDTWRRVLGLRDNRFVQNASAKITSAKVRAVVDEGQND